MAKLQKFSPLWQRFSPLWQKWRENVRYFRHYGKNRWQNDKNGEKMFAIFAIMAKIDGRIDGKMAKINDKNGYFFLAILVISPWRISRKK